MPGTKRFRKRGVAFRPEQIIGKGRQASSFNTPTFALELLYQGVNQYERESELLARAPVAQVLREADQCQDKEALLSNPS